MIEILILPVVLFSFFLDLVLNHFWWCVGGMVALLFFGGGSGGPGYYWPWH
jgi:hypothetical protein